MHLPDQETSGLQSGQPPVALTEQEKEHLLHLFNNTDRQYATHHTLIDLFRNTVAGHPGKTALICDGESITYRQLDEAGNQVARYLHSIGIGAGSLVPVWFDRSIDLLVAIIGILKSGAAYIPIDYSYPTKRAAYILADSGAHVLLSDHPERKLLPRNVLSVTIQDAAIQHQSVTAPADIPAPDDLAYVIYTSGSTGNPKGVMVTHRSVQHLVSWHNAHFKVNAESVLSFVAGTSFDIAVWEIWSALAAGGTLCIANNEERTNAAQLVAFYDRFRITHGFVPTVLAPDVTAASRQHTLALKYLFTGGEKLKPVNTAGLPYTLIDYYGPTECTVFATFHTVNRPDGSYVSSIGKPIANTRAYVLGPQLELLPVGAAGELCISGACLAKGYWNNPELTVRKFVDHPFRPDEKMYKTGDLVRRLPDGDIEFIGRIDKQVKIRGYRIELGEIENALLQAPGVRQAVVTVRETSRHNKVLVAFIVAQKKKKADGAVIRQHLREELPGYMVPAYFVFIDAIPVNANGKTDVNRLLEYPLQQDAVTTTEAATDEEALVIRVWSQLLDRAVIDPADNFFDIGGDSLLVAAAATDIARSMEVKVYLRDIYQHPTVRALTAVLTERKKTTADLPEEDVEPVIELQNDVYLTPDTVITGSFDPERLRNPKHIFLTGVTGFIGINLLEELLLKTTADVHCLIRAKNEYDALLKIDDVLERFQIRIDRELKKRIVAVVGDLTQPGLGLPAEQFDKLAGSIDVIYHSASSVNFIEPYSFNKAPNVDGLREIIRFAASSRLKCLVLLSTISVYSWGHVFTGKTVMTEKDDIRQNIKAVSKDIGYVRSKYVMEEIADLAASKGLPVITHRLGYAMCHSRTGACASYQWWAGLVKVCLKHNAYPGLTELREGLITVDYMVQSIAHISSNPEAIGLKFNLIASPSDNLTLDDFFRLMQAYYPLALNRLPYREWRGLWEDNNKCELYPLTSLFRDNMHEGLSTVELYQHTYVWDNSQVKQFLEGSGIVEPVFDKKVMDAYLGYLGIRLS